MSAHLHNASLLAWLCALLLYAGSTSAQMCEARSTEAQQVAIRNAPGGKLLGHLPNGSHLFLRRLEWGEHGDAALVAAVFKGQWRDLGFAAEADLDCRTAPDDSPYPLVFSSAADLRPLGIALQHYGTGAVTLHANRCFYYGDGGYDMSLSDEFVASNQARGFSFELMCLVLRTGGLRFDPETGTRLPTYMVIDQPALDHSGGQYLEPGVISEELPLQIPACFKGVSEIRQTDLGREIGFSCDIRFDPWTGLELSAAEAAHYRQHITLGISGEAGPSASPADARLALSSKKRATRATVQAVMELIQPGAGD